MPINRLFNRLLKAELLHYFEKVVDAFEDKDVEEEFNKRYEKYQQYERHYEQQQRSGSSGQNQRGSAQSGFDQKEKVYYDVLELAPGASWEDIKKAYRTLQKKYHPDRFHNDSTKRALAERVSRKLNEAYAYFEATKKPKA